MPQEYYSPRSGGAVSTVTMESAAQLIKRGHDVSVVTARDENELYSVGEVHPFEMPRREGSSLWRRQLSYRIGRWHGYSWPFYDVFVRRVLRLIAQLKACPDLFITHNDFVLADILRRTYPQAAIFCWIHNETCTEYGRLDEALRAPDQFVAVSDYIRDWMVARYNIPAAKFVVVPSGVDLEAFRPRNGFLGPGGTPKVLFIGRIDRNKGPDVAADAVAALQREGLDVQLTVAGGLWFYGNKDPMSDPFFRMLNDKMKRVGANYLGHVARSEVPGLIREHDLVCVLSRSNEPFGLVALEAMASGCAVIASNRGGLPEACGGAAELVDPDDGASIVNCMRRLVLDRAYLASCKRRSLDRAQHAPWAMTAAKLERALAAKGIADIQGRSHLRPTDNLNLVKS